MRCKACTAEWIEITNSEPTPSLFSRDRREAGVMWHTELLPIIVIVCGIAFSGVAIASGYIVFVHSTIVS